MCAPSAIRTRDLLLRSNPALDAVAISDGAGHACGGTCCCSQSYLVITIRDTGHDCIPGHSTDRTRKECRAAALPILRRRPGQAALYRPWDGVTHFFRVFAWPALYTAGMSSDVPTGQQRPDPRPAPALPEHLSALVGSLHGPEDLGRYHDKYLRYADREEAGGAASA